MAKVRIRDAKNICTRDGAQAVAIIQVERNGTVTVVTWAEDEKKCGVIGEWAQGLYQFAITKVPFQTVFGHGTKGKAAPLTCEEYESLNEVSRAFADRNWGQPANWYDYEFEKLAEKSVDNGDPQTEASLNGGEDVVSPNGPDSGC